MATFEETVDTFAKDLQTQNIAGLMMVFTPEGMMKAMAMQGQMQARAAEAMAAGKPPAPITSYSVDLLGEGGEGGEERVAHINLLSADGSAEIATRWRQVDGLWKVNDLQFIGARNPDGTPAQLPGS